MRVVSVVCVRSVNEVFVSCVRVLWLCSFLVCVHACWKCRGETTHAAQHAPVKQFSQCESLVCVQYACSSCVCACIFVRDVRACLWMCASCFSLCMFCDSVCCVCVKVTRTAAFLTDTCRIYLAGQRNVFDKRRGQSLNIGSHRLCTQRHETKGRVNLHAL